MQANEIYIYLFERLVQNILTKNLKANVLINDVSF